MKAALPENELDRLNALRRYQILDTPPDGAFDHIVEMAANFFRVPIAIVSLVDEDRIWFKSHYGIESDQVGRDPGLCASAILSPEVYYLRDALHDVRAMANPLVAGSLGLRFYAAAPLRTHDGFSLGTLCVIDREPRDLASGEAEMLARMAALVMDQMELRLAAKKIAELERAERSTSERLRQANERLAESEERFRDLFSEAPIAYLQATDTRILRANRTAIKILGVRPDEVEGLLATSFVPDSPEAQRRLRDALALLATGTDEKGMVLELRRKDDGRPLWVRWWCKPDPTGKYTRSMFTDITEQVVLEQENTRLEEQFRDLFEEAPIAYVLEGLDSGFIRANRAALRILGVKPEEVSGMFGKSLVPDTPDAQRRLREALDSIGRGTDTSGVVLEMRRKDDGKPVWVEWWSRPEAGGKYTRTMFIDITDRVLLEQEKARLESQNAYLLDEIRSEQNFGDIIGKSPGLRKVMQQIQHVAPTDATVLITGESGTGKELVALAIHEHSARNGRPLIKLNCSAVPEGLFESEFFGHVKGAFTGALKDKPGRFELADGGTLFLDEIGEVPLAMQAKLLRVLQEQELERIGDTRTRKVSVRVIAATNRDLKEEVDEGRFREDLFYRLSVFPIEVPPLRQRREDIAPIAAHFIRQSARRMNRPEPPITKAALSQLASYDWPGNVRELQNVIERTIILWQEGPLTFDLATSRTSQAQSASVDTPLTPALLTRDELRRQERDAIAAALKQTNGKIYGPGGAAELLGLKPTTLASRISALGLNRRTLN
jgi:PAS domain S-box-containing protein